MLKRFRKLKLNEVIAIVGVIFVLAFAVSTAFGATVNFPVQYSGDYDSVRVWLWKDWVIVADTGTVAGTDTISFTTFPVTDTLVLDDGSDYEMKSWYYFDDGSTTTIGTILIKFTAGAVSISDADMSAIWDTGAGRGLADGDRSYAVRRYAIDTSGTDDTLAGVSITARTNTGSLILSKLTTSEGWADFSLDSGETRWTATKGSAYSFNQKIDTITAADTGDVTGYNTVIASPSDPDLARVYGFIRSSDNIKLEGVTVVATRPSGNVSDTADGIFYADVAATTGSDTGYFYLDLVRTNQYDDTTLGTYTITGNYGGQQVFLIPDVTVPSSGNLDLGTIIAARKEN